jgi:hypothetical protein
MIGDDLVHDFEEFDAPPAFVMAPDDLAAFKIERGEERRRPVTFVVVRLAGDGALLVVGFHVRCLQNVIKKRNWGRWQVDATIL